MSQNQLQMIVRQNNKLRQMNQKKTKDVEMGFEVHRGMQEKKRWSKVKDFIDNAAIGEELT